MTKILQIIIAVLVISWVYLSTQAFDVTKQSDKQESTWYNEDIEWDFTFWDFTTFRIVHNTWTVCNAFVWSCGAWEYLDALRGCFWNDNVAYNQNDYEACGWNPWDIRRWCNAGRCYTGTWSNPSMPSCDNSCWVAAVRKTNYSQCNNWDCRPGDEKPSKSRNCPKTTDCTAPPVDEQQLWCYWDHLAKNKGWWCQGGNKCGVRQVATKTQTQNEYHLIWVSTEFYVNGNSQSPVVKPTCRATTEDINNPPSSTPDPSVPSEQRGFEPDECWGYKQPICK